MGSAGGEPIEHREYLDVPLEYPVPLGPGDDGLVLGHHPSSLPIRASLIRPSPAAAFGGLFCGLKEGCQPLVRALAESCHRSPILPNLQSQAPGYRADILARRNRRPGSLPPKPHGGLQEPLLLARLADLPALSGESPEEFGPTLNPILILFQIHLTVKPRGVGMDAV